MKYGVSLIQGDQLRHKYIPEESNQIYGIPRLLLHNTFAFKDFQKRHFKQAGAKKKIKIKMHR